MRIYLHIFQVLFQCKCFAAHRSRTYRPPERRFLCTLECPVIQWIFPLDIWEGISNGHLGLISNDSPMILIKKYQTFSMDNPWIQPMDPTGSYVLPWIIQPLVTAVVPTPWQLQGCAIVGASAFCAAVTRAFAMAITVFEALQRWWMTGIKWPGYANDIYIYIYWLVNILVIILVIIMLAWYEYMLTGMITSMINWHTRMS